MLSSQRPSAGQTWQRTAGSNESVLPMSWRDTDSQNGILQNAITRLRTTSRLRLLAMLVGFGFLLTVVLPSGNHRPPPPHWGPHPPFPPEEDGSWEFDPWGASGGKDHPVKRPPPPTADEQLWTKRAEEVSRRSLPQRLESPAFFQSLV